MPPKPKFTREQVAQTALEIVKQEGVDALTARELGKRLNASASPIFTVFRGMDEVKAEARVLGLREFETYIGDFRDYTPAFKRVGMRMVLFGMREPKLYQLLFMEENTTAASFDDLFNRLGPTAQSCIDTICDTYGLTGAQARMLFENVWIYTFGVGALCATRVCSFSQQQLGQMLTTQFQGMMMLIKSGNYPSNGQGD